MKRKEWMKKRWKESNMKRIKTLDFLLRLDKSIHAVFKIDNIEEAAMRRHEKKEGVMIS